VGSAGFLSSSFVVLSKHLESISDRLIRHVARNASQGLRSILVFFAQHIASIPDSLNVRVGVARAAASKEQEVKFNDVVLRRTRCLARIRSGRTISQRVIFPPID
jgi:hypothetical protein